LKRRPVHNQVAIPLGTLNATGLTFRKAIAYFFGASPTCTKKSPSRGTGGAPVSAPGSAPGRRTAG